MTSPDTATLDASTQQIPDSPENWPPSWLRRILTIVAAWSTAWWLLLGTLLAPVLPGHWATVLLAAVILAFVPLVFLARALSGAYPRGRAVAGLPFVLGHATSPSH
jgi:hypothetical protein